MGFGTGMGGRAEGIDMACGESEQGWPFFKQLLEQSTRHAQFAMAYSSSD